MEHTEHLLCCNALKGTSKSCEARWYSFQRILDQVMQDLKWKNQPSETDFQILYFKRFLLRILFLHFCHFHINDESCFYAFNIILPFLIGKIKYCNKKVLILGLNHIVFLADKCLSMVFAPYPKNLKVVILHWFN